MMSDFSVSNSELRILVVEDEPSTRSALIRALRLMGYQTEGAATGDEALERLALEMYHFMILDLRLPGTDGVAVMKRVQQMHPSTLVIMLTAHGSLDSAIEAIRAGAVDYLLKPCGIKDIEEAISRAVQTWRVEMRRKHLLEKMQGALEALREEEGWAEREKADLSERVVLCGPLCLDEDRLQVTVSGRSGSQDGPVDLTERETAILAYMMKRPDVILSCLDLARFALGEQVDQFEARGIIRPHISRLRKKIEKNPARPKLIRTVRGKGYLLSSDGLGKDSRLK
jgi:DNA-binding response OmpR family regulator